MIGRKRGKARGGRKGEGRRRTGNWEWKEDEKKIAAKREKERNYSRQAEMENVDRHRIRRLFMDRETR